jgi:hypothetical protein
MNLWPQILSATFMILAGIIAIIKNGQNTPVDASRTIVALAWWATILGLGGFWNFK